MMCTVHVICGARCSVRMEVSAAHLIIIVFSNYGRQLSVQYPTYTGTLYLYNVKYWYHICGRCNFAKYFAIVAGSQKPDSAMFQRSNYWTKWGEGLRRSGCTYLEICMVGVLRFWGKMMFVWRVCVSSRCEVESSGITQQFEPCNAHTLENIVLKNAWIWISKTREYNVI